LNLNFIILKECCLSASENDFNFDEIWKDALNGEITEFCPDFVGVTCMFTQTHKSAVKVCQNIKRSGARIPVAVGGVHITNCFMDPKANSFLLNDFCGVDFFFLYESELAFKNFIQFVNRSAGAEGLRQVYFNFRSKFYFSERFLPNGEDLDIIPALDLMNTAELTEYGVIGSFFWLKSKGTKITTLLSNRGCRGRCTYCSVRNFNGVGVRQRSIASVIEELLLLRNKFGISHVMWLDDDFFFNHSRAMALFQEMIDKDTGITWDCTNGVVASSCTEEMVSLAAKSGCIGLNIGVESGNPEVLKLIQKPGTKETFLKAAEVLKGYETINARVFLMIGFPNETLRMIRDTFSLALKMDLDWYNITICQPLPNTPLFDDFCDDNGLLKIVTEDIRYNAGPYGKRLKEPRSQQMLMDDLGSPVGQHLDKVPGKPELNAIWFDMNFHLNFMRLFKEKRALKLNQQLKYLQNITDLVAPEDPFPMYFCAYLQKKVLHEIDGRLISRLEACLAEFPGLREKFQMYKLSVGHLKTGKFPFETGFSGEKIRGSYLYEHCC
jgi:radical SAM superfamily enzyme YgiQ (UPF0313 family)